jgi:hypothetical protein
MHTYMNGRMDYGLGLVNHLVFDGFLYDLDKSGGIGLAECMEVGCVFRHTRRLRSGLFCGRFFGNGFGISWNGGRRGGRVISRRPK